MTLSVRPLIGAEQRAALPAPAQTLADSLGDRIAALSPTLERIDAKSVEAAEIRRLVAEELPELVANYQRVPKAMRTIDRNGRVRMFFKRAHGNPYFHYGYYIIDYK